MRLISSQDRQAHRFRARRQQQTVIGNGATAGDDDIARFGIDRGDIAFEPKVDAGLRVKAVRTQRQPILRRATGKIILRQIWPIDRRSGIVAQHDDVAAKILPPQHVCRGKARRAATDDYDLAGRIDGSLAARLRLLALLPDEDAIALVLNLPDSERDKRRRARSLPSAQIEARVMPGTADALADYESIRERPVIMAAMRVDGENLRSGADQQDVLVADMAEQGLAGKVT